MIIRNRVKLIKTLETEQEITAPEIGSSHYGTGNK